MDRGRDRSRDTFSALALPLPLASGGAGSNPGGSPGESGGRGGPGGAGGVSGGSRGTSGSSKEVNSGGDGELVSSPPSFSGVISRSWRPESSFHNTTIVHSRGSNAVLKKLNLGYRRNPHANWS